MAYPEKQFFWTTLLMINTTFKINIILCVTLQAYSAQLPISQLKKKDLMELLRTGVIPETFRTYYEGLPSNAQARDELPDSDIDDYDE